MGAQRAPASGAWLGNLCARLPTGRPDRRLGTDRSRGWLGRRRRRAGVPGQGGNKTYDNGQQHPKQGPTHPCHRRPSKAVTPAANIRW